MSDSGERIAYLEMIQGVINRMASSSFMLKGWSVTMVSALFALAAKDSQTGLVFVAMLPAALFWGLDGYFLDQERRFRALFDSARKSENVTFSMATSPLGSGWWSAIFSKTLIVFHGSIAAAIVLAAILLNRGK